MKEYYYVGDFAGNRLFFAFRHPDTAAYFRGWLSPVRYDEVFEDSLNENTGPVAKIIIRIPENDCNCWIQEYGMLDDGNTEFGMSVNRASDVLLKNSCCVIHGAAMLWHGKAWLFIADSGTGKSTQLSHWKALFPEEVQIMNGDKPILRIDDVEKITVHPSPWKGKEEWGDDALQAQLGGIILLKQGKQNEIHVIPPVYCVARLLSLFFSAFETEDTIHRLCRFQDKILQTVPVLQLTNLGDQDSASLTHDTLVRMGM